MRSILKWVGRSLFAATVAGAMMLGGPRLAMATDCDYDRPPAPYTCPPHDNDTCFSACELAQYEGGECMTQGSSTICCVCFY